MDFVQKLKDLKVLPSHSQVQYLLMSLQNRLLQNLTWKVRTNPNLDQITHLGFCLDTTYFMFKGNILQALTVAYLFMEHFKQMASQLAPTPPHIWYCYDTFSKMHCSSIGI